MQHESIEIRRLQAIIDALSDRNLLLEHENAALRARLQGQSISKQWSDKDDFPPTQYEGRSTYSSNPPAHFIAGSINTFDTPLLTALRSNNLLDTPKEDEGRRMINSATPARQTERVQKVLVLPTPVRAVAPLRPGDLAAGELPTAEALGPVLRRHGMGPVHHAGLWRAAALLLLVAAQPGRPLPYARIQHELGLSEDGACKLVMSLRRRGWLRRNGWQHFALTDAGIALIKEALNAQGTPAPTRGGAGPQ